MGSNKETDGGQNELQIPKDKYYLVHFIFFLIGIGSFIPYTFFVTANGYWMYKFRDTSLNTTDADNRTTLQSHFSAAMTFSGSFPGLLFLCLAKKYLHYFDLKIRTLVCLGTVVVPFVVATICIYVNTDSWQMGFFVFTLLQNLIIGGVNGVSAINVFGIMANFPPSILKAHIIGQGITGVFNSLLQIFSLWLGPSVHTSALIYFLTGTFILILVFLSFVLCNSLEYYQFHIKKEIANEEDSFRDMFKAFKKIWHIGVFLEFQLVAQTLLHPAVTSLVISEYEGKGEWGDVYFTPVATFLLENVTSLLGRIIAARIKFFNKLKGPALMVFSILRSAIFIFLIVSCNAKPRHHFPILFPHDYQYIIILGIYGLTAGFLFTVTFTTIPNYLPPEKLNTGFSAVLLFTSSLSLITAPVSLFSINIL